MAESKKKAEERRNPREKKRSKLRKSEKESIVKALNEMKDEGVRTTGSKRMQQPAMKKRSAERKRQRAERRKKEEEDGTYRVCQGFNLAGEPCKTPPLNPGREFEGVVASGNFCLVHDPEIDQSAWRSKFIGGSRPVSPLQALGDAFSKAPKLLFEAHLDGLGLEWDEESREIRPKLLPNGKRARGATIVGFSREGVAKKSKYKDVALQAKLAAELQDRIFGKPRQSMEIGAASMSAPKPPMTEGRATEVALILREAGALPD